MDFTATDLVLDFTTTVGLVTRKEVPRDSVILSLDERPVQLEVKLIHIFLSLAHFNLYFRIFGTCTWFSCTWRIWPRTLVQRRLLFPIPLRIKDVHEN